MRGALGGPRVLLRRLREVMAEKVSAQERLDKIVVLIAANMVAEVCSVYVLRVDGTLELYATEGLRKEAVHQTVLRADEGLVGLVASQATPINLSEAQGHPAFSYRPETGEEIYHSFLGVPVLRAGNTLGVLVVQNWARRTYTEEEEEALQTTAMVLAEMIASGELATIAKPGLEPAAGRPLHLDGTALNEGMALGHVVLHEPRVVITNFIADDVQKELKRLETAIETMRSDLDALLERGEVADGGEHRDVLEAYRMFAYDRGWVHRLEEAVATGLTAEAAVERVQSDTRARMLRATDPYLRERLHDLDELANRLMHHLLGQDYAPARDRLPENAVLVARSMGPAALLEYDRKRLRGLVLEEGGPHSHVAIVARALGIPAVGEIANATGVVDPGDAIIVDGSTGDVHVRPSPDMEAAYVERVRLRARRQLQYHALRNVPCVTKDGTSISLMLNAGLAVDLPHLEETGAAGIGLFRTELQFMVAASLPRAAEQFGLYRAVLDAAGDKPVTFRTLDIGGDKVLPYMRNVEEENPALGWRAIRLGLDRPGLLRSQVRALLRAGSGRELKIMFPMIATIEEFDEARSLIERELTHLRRHGHKLPERVEVGTMVEVPSLLYQLDELLERVDFLSVGSNDLVQFFYAADRGNVRVATRFDPISTPVLRALRIIAKKAETHSKPVTLCGEIASTPIGALALVAIGYRSLSITPTAIGPVKAMLLELHAAKAAALLEPLIDRPAGSIAIREQLEKFAAEEGLQNLTRTEPMLPQQKLDALVTRYRLIERELASQMASEIYVKLSRELAELGPIVDTIESYRAVRAELAGLEAMLADPAIDAEMRSLASAERTQLEQRRSALEQAIKLALLPKDAMDERNVILEIRAGTGGDEAALFAGDLFRMYERYAAKQGWKIEVISASAGAMGGYKEIIAEIRGRGAFSRLKFESGVHRVQRVPDTEGSGRIHTSTATVAVLPEVEEVDVAINDADLKVDTLRSGGAGGQHVNKTESAVRVTHVPSGIVVMMQEDRSQHRNRAKAMAILRARLYDFERQKRDAERAAERRGQVGSGDRSERIRTYNFPQGRVSDHRINLTLYKLPQVIEGEALGEIVDALVTEHQAELLAAEGVAE